MGIKEEITKIAVEQGYEGAKPKSIAQAIDALTDTLAGEDVSSGRSVVDAIRKYAPYVGKGGGGTKRVELFNETVTTETNPDTGFNAATLAFTGTITDDPLHVVFDGVEYELPKLDDGGYGDYTFQTYPFGLLIDDRSGRWHLETKDAGTHTIVAYTEKSSGSGFEPKGAWTIDQDSINRITAIDIDSDGSFDDGIGDIYYNELLIDDSYANPGSVACGLYVTLFVQADNENSAGKLAVVRNKISGSEELPNVVKEVRGTQVTFMFQVPEDAPAAMETLAVTKLGGED